MTSGAGNQLGQSESCCVMVTAFSLVPNSQAGGLGSLRCDFAIESHYAVAPGLAATVSYQDLSARLSAGTGMLSARVAKSTATSA
jgi:hypothetical protein